VDLKNSLHTILSTGELDRVVRSFDVVGDIAIILVPAELAHRESTISAAILETNRRIKVVVKRESHFHGAYRTIRLKIIGGENRKVTVHREFGIRLKLNLEEVYFSVRSATERRRIAALVEPGEDVLVLFSGVAPYPLHIARFSEAGSITGIEKNPRAHHYAEININLNKAAGKIVLHHGDVEDVCPCLGASFDRIVMPLPKAGFRFLSPALCSLKSQARLHFYTIQTADSILQTVNALQQKCSEQGRPIIDYRTVVCGHTGPRHYRYCIDAIIR